MPNGDQQAINELATEVVRQSDLLTSILIAATRHPRCCDLYIDSLGGVACCACKADTFKMMREIQQLLGVGKDCQPLEP